MIRFSFRRCGRLLSHAAPALAASLAALSTASASTPEYLAAEEPIPDSLEATPSVTEHIGEPPDSRSLAGRIRTRRMFPGLRRRFPTSGQPFLDDAVFRMRPRAYYWNSDDGGGGKSEALAYGGEFGVESGYFADAIRLGFTGYTSQKIYGPAGRDGSGLLRAGQKAYTVLGEAYADIVFEKTGASLFRQRVDLPYLNANDWRMTPNTFEAYTLRATAIPKLQIGVGHVEKIKFRNSSDFEYLSAHAGAAGSKKGVSAIGARYDFSDEFNVGLVEEYGWDTFNTLYLETERLFQLDGDFSLKTGVQFTDQRGVGDALVGAFETQHLGYKLALGYQSLIVSSSFTWTSRGSGIRKPWGGSPSYNSVMIADFDRAGEKAIRAGISYDFSKLGLDGFATSATWLYGDTPDSGSDASPDQQEVNINFDYRPTVKGLDNFWLRARYAVNDRDASQGGNDRNDLRVILNYSLSF